MGAVSHAEVIWLIQLPAPNTFCHFFFTSKRSTEPCHSIFSLGHIFFILIFASPFCSLALWLVHNSVLFSQASEGKMCSEFWSVFGCNSSSCRPTIPNMWSHFPGKEEGQSIEVSPAVHFILKEIALPPFTSSETIHSALQFPIKWKAEDLYSCICLFSQCLRWARYIYICSMMVCINRTFWLTLHCSHCFLQVLMCSRRILVKCECIISRAQHILAAISKISFFIAAHVNYSSGFCTYRTETLV